MQYAQRKLQRSVIETRRSLTRRGERDRSGEPAEAGRSCGTSPGQVTGPGPVSCLRGSRGGVRSRSPLGAATNFSRRIFASPGTAASRQPQRVGAFATRCRLPVLHFAHPATRCVLVVPRSVAIDKACPRGNPASVTAVTSRVAGIPGFLGTVSEQQDPDLGAGVDALAVVEERQAVGARHARQHVARLDARPARTRSGRRRARPAPGRGAASRRAAARIAAAAVARTVSAATSVRPASLRSAGRANSSKLTRDETGFPGRPNAGTAPSIANASGFAGLIATCAHSDEPPRSLRDPFEHELHEVVVADRHRAARQQHVARSRPRARSPSVIARLVVADDAAVDRLAPELFEQREQHRPVRVADAARRERARARRARRRSRSPPTRGRG